MRISRRTSQTTSLLVGGLALSLVATGCAGSAKDQEDQAADGMIAQLTFPAEVDATVGGLGNYNPYSPTPLTAVWLYEPLIVRNNLTCEETPWLATDATWDGGDKLTLDIREGVKWSDGEDFTADDVAFTLNLQKEFPGMDKSGLWNDTFGAPAKSVTADGNQVVIEFEGNAAAKYDGIISTKILPEHVYADVDDPTTYVDKEPVGTGPFEVESYNGRRLTLARRDDYWQADKIKVEKIVQEGIFDSSQAALKLETGEIDAYYGDIPNPQRTVVDKDPDNTGFFYAPAGTTVLTGNLTEEPWSDPKFREAISYGMDKESMSEKGIYGIMEPASQTGLKLPAMEDLLPEEYAGADTVLPYDPDKAAEMLDAAGYEEGADGKRTMPDGSPLSVDFSVQAGFIDYEAIAEVVADDLNDLGVDTKVTASAPESVDEQKKTGDFNAVLEYLHGGCELARNLGSKLNSKQFPTEQDIFPNVGRYSDPATDDAIAQLSGATSREEQKPYLGELVDVMMTEYPVTSLIYAPSRTIYRTDHAEGWPTEDNPYASGADDRLLVMTHLVPPS
ncbi:ABC transporter substrate-binding protein [Nocardioides baculatus]|uniref:ABC transporter substrate-binding protein n=1 Tax=Nocardioides baculatus TaxID=2801337 RepID=A0ABS1LCS9_9ACTN|nr:ABC transporter substrate-binding protein [Nocardioides baculatus]MBL0749489.1 ABC transporter substrate-binding protein [Nocardioides baculatus]